MLSARPNNTLKRSMTAPDAGCFTTPTKRTKLCSSSSSMDPDFDARANKENIAPEYLHLITALSSSASGSGSGSGSARGSSSRRGSTSSRRSSKSTSSSPTSAKSRRSSVSSVASSYSLDFSLDTDTLPAVPPPTPISEMSGFDFDFELAALSLAKAL